MQPPENSHQRLDAQLAEIDLTTVRGYLMTEFSEKPQQSAALQNLIQQQILEWWRGGHQALGTLLNQLLPRIRGRSIAEGHEDYLLRALGDEHELQTLEQSATTLLADEALHHAAEGIDELEACKRYTLRQVLEAINTFVKDQQASLPAVPSTPEMPPGDPQAAAQMIATATPTPAEPEEPTEPSPFPLERLEILRGSVESRPFKEIIIEAMDTLRKDPAIQEHAKACLRDHYEVTQAAETIANKKRGALEMALFQMAYAYCAGEGHSSLPKFDELDMEGVPLLKRLGGSRKHEKNRQAAFRMLKKASEEPLSMQECRELRALWGRSYDSEEDRKICNALEEAFRAEVERMEAERDKSIDNIAPLQRKTTPTTPPQRIFAEPMQDALEPIPLGNAEIRFAMSFDQLAALCSSHLQAHFHPDEALLQQATETGALALMHKGSRATMRDGRGERAERLHRAARLLPFMILNHLTGKPLAQYPTYDEVMAKQGEEKGRQYLLDKGGCHEGYYYSLQSSFNDNRADIIKVLGKTVQDHTQIFQFGQLIKILQEGILAHYEGECNLAFNQRDWEYCRMMRALEMITLELITFLKRIQEGATEVQTGINRGPAASA